MPNWLQRTLQRAIFGSEEKGALDVAFGGPGPDTWKPYLMFKQGEAIGGDGLTEPYKHVAALSTAIGLIAEDAASVPWELFNDSAESDEPIEDHPVLNLWDKPNEQMAGSQLWVGTYISELLFGEAWWYYPELVLPQGVNPRLDATIGGGLDLLDPGSVEWNPEADRWELQISAGQRIPLDPDRLTQFKRWNPYNRMRGLSKVTAVVAELEGDYAAAQWNKRFFGDQNGIPSGLLIPNQGSQLDDSQRRDLQRTWAQKHGSKRAVGVLPAGWTFQDLGISLRDMDFKALREYSREQVFSAFGVPPFMGGILDKANYANARKQEELYWQGTITRFLRRFQQTLNHDFLPKIGVTGITVSPKSEIIAALVEDLNEKTDIANKWFAMGVPKSVINTRLEMGWNEDDFEDWETGYLPFSVAPVGEVAMPRTPAGPALPPGDDEEEPDSEDQKRLRGHIHDGDREQRRTLVWKNIILRMTDLERQFESRIRSHLKDLENEALEHMDGSKGWKMDHGLVGPSSPTPGGRPVFLTKAATEFGIFDVEEANRKVKKVTKKVYQQTYKRGAETILADLGIGIAFDLQAHPAALARLEYTLTQVTRINATVDKQLRTALLEGVNAGEGLEGLRGRVENVFEVSRGRARTIARTEVGKTFNTSRFHTMRDQGIKKIEWLSSRDADVRDSHWGVDSEVIDVGEAFSNGLAYPQDPGGPPGEVINCRCVALPVVE